MDLTHLSLPSWFLWLAGALGLVTAIITIFNSVRIYNQSEIFDGIFDFLGRVLKGTLAIALPILGILAVIAACALGGNAIYTAFKDYVEKPQVQIVPDSTLNCDRLPYQHEYLKIANTTDTSWRYAIAVDDKDPAGATWASVPEFATGLLELNDAIMVEIRPTPQLCADMGNNTQLALGVTVTFTAASPSAADTPGSATATPTSAATKPHQVTLHLTVTILR